MTLPESFSEGKNLCARISAGDRTAFDDLVRAHYTGLCNFVFGLIGSRSAAEDIVQDVLLAVWEGRGRLDPRRYLKSYLYTAARNRARNHLKHLKVRDRWREGASGMRPAGRRYTDEDVEYAELLEAAQAAVERLPDRRREVFILSRQDGLSHAEIAAVLGISVKAVETHIARSLAFLRRELSAYIAEP